MPISIALATYNGEKYITEQLNSILPQLTEGDEIVISDDGSTDKTLEIIAGFCSARINVYSNPKKGVISNFENAISHATGDVIFLCDQDDVWCPDKIAVCLSYFSSPDVKLVVSDAYITDSALNIIDDSFYKLMNSGGGFAKNFIKNTFLGCCMAFRNELKNIILPFPEKIPMHDSWIGLLTQLNGKTLFIPEKLVYYRRHDQNTTVLKRNSVLKSLSWRRALLIELIMRKFGGR
jgi:glycosyltransferase involved in cell wall biosynthesis